MSKCKSCLGSDIKGAILETLPGLSDVLDAIPTCDSEMDIEICPSESCGHGGARKKRAPSAYNTHTGICMKSGKSMKTCAEEWKAKKGA